MADYVSDIIDFFDIDVRTVISLPSTHFVGHAYVNSQQKEYWPFKHVGSIQVFTMDIQMVKQYITG